MFGSDHIFPIFMIIWVILGGSGFVLFYLGKNGRLKRRLWPVYIIVGGILFVVFVSLDKPPFPVCIILIPGVFYISAKNISMIRFCLSCGRMVMPEDISKRPDKCPKCNADLNRKDDDSSDLSALRAGGDDSES